MHCEVPDLTKIIPDFELSVVMRHIAYKKRSTFLSVAAIAVAVAISLISVSMQDGFQGMLFDIIVEDLPHVTVTPKEGDDYIYLYKTLMDRAWAIPGVVTVSPSLGAEVTLVKRRERGGDFRVFHDAGERRMLHQADDPLDHFASLDRFDE